MTFKKVDKVKSLQIGNFRKFYRFLFKHSNLRQKHQHDEDSSEGKHEHAYFHRVKFLAKSTLSQMVYYALPIDGEKETTKGVCLNRNSTLTQNIFHRKIARTLIDWMPAMNVTTIAKNEIREKSPFIVNDILWFYAREIERKVTQYSLRMESTVHTCGNRQRWTTTTTTNNWIWFDFMEF